MGCNWVLAREVAKEPEREGDWAAVGVTVGLATSALYLVAGYFLIPLLLPSDRGYLLPVARLCLLLIPMDMFNQVLLAVEHGRMRWRRYNLMRFSFSFFYLHPHRIHRGHSESPGALVRLRISCGPIPGFARSPLDSTKIIGRRQPAIRRMPPFGASWGALFRCNHQQSRLASVRHHPGRQPADDPGGWNLCRCGGVCQRTVFPRRRFRDHFFRRSFE